MNPYENGLMSIPHYRYISISSNSYISHRWSPLKSSEFLHLWPASSFLWPISLSSSSCFRGGSAGVSVVETACLRDSVKLATLQPFSRLGAAPHITFSLCKSTSWKVGWNARSYPQPNRLRQPVMLLSFPTEHRAPTYLEYCMSFRMRWQRENRWAMMSSHEITSLVVKSKCWLWHRCSWPNLDSLKKWIFLFPA